MKKKSQTYTRTYNNSTRFTRCGKRVRERESATIITTTQAAACSNGLTDWLARVVDDDSAAAAAAAAKISPVFTYWAHTYSWMLTQIATSSFTLQQIGHCFALNQFDLTHRYTHAHCTHTQTRLGTNTVALAKFSPVTHAKLFTLQFPLFIVDNIFHVQVMPISKCWMGKLAATEALSNPYTAYTEFESMENSLKKIKRKQTSVQACGSFIRWSQLIPKLLSSQNKRLSTNNGVWSMLQNQSPSKRRHKRIRVFRSLSLYFVRAGEFRMRTIR